MTPLWHDGNKQFGLVARPNIEAPARLGYYDALAGRGFADAYATAEPPWQRNYEIGRLWAVGMLKCGITPPDWPEGMKQQPPAINAALGRVNEKIGNLRPEVSTPFGMETVVLPADPDLPMLHKPIDIRAIRRMRGKFRR